MFREKLTKYKNFSRERFVLSTLDVVKPVRQVAAARLWSHSVFGNNFWIGVSDARYWRYMKADIQKV